MRPSLGEGPAQADDDALDAAVADQEVGADADRGNGDGGIEAFQEIGEIVLVLRQEEDISGAADPQPGEGGKGLIAEQLAANEREAVAPGHRADRRTEFWLLPHWGRGTAHGVVEGALPEVSVRRKGPLSRFAPTPPTGEQPVLWRRKRNV